MKITLRLSYLCGLLILSTPLFAATTFQFDSTDSNLSLPGGFSPADLTTFQFVATTGNPNVTVNNFFTAGTLSSGITPSSTQSGSNTSTIGNVDLVLDFYVNNSATPTSATLVGNLVEEGWMGSAGDWSPMDVLEFNGGTVQNGYEIAPLGNTGYNVQISSSALALGKGQSISVRVVSAIPEPTTWGTLALGLIGLVTFGFRRRAFSK